MDPVASGVLPLSIVIPTHNRRELLRKVLAALDQQTYPAHQFEVIVVVDGSTDGTADMLQGLRPAYQFRVLDQEQSGPAAARNAGIAMARGQAIVFLDDDVVPRQGFVASHATYHDADRHAVVIGRVAPCPWGDRPGWERWEDSMAQRDYDRILAGGDVGGGLFFTWNVSVSRACLDEVGGFDRRLAFQEDIDLGYRLAAAGAHFYFGDGAVGYHCGHRPDFATWCRRHYRFGYYRGVMQFQHGSGGPLSLRESYADYHPLTRMVLRLTVGRPLLGRAVASGLRQGVDVLDGMRLWGASRYVYSVLAIHHYWLGVADALNGPSTLRHLLFDRTESRAPVVGST